MKAQTVTAATVERVVLAGVMLEKDTADLFEQDMQEMELLCGTAGVEVVGKVVQKRASPVSSTYIGSGKLEEIKQLMGERDSKTLILDAPLSPAQVRNIEDVVEAKVLDRSQLILDIFARHATTSESRLQVELAQMRTLYPRLTQAWSHFSRQYAGVGTKGPGEKQLEVDRRLVQKRIHDLGERLKEVDKNRGTQRRSRRDVPKAALIGYTNVGKSSLLNKLTRARALVENKLFATLDTTTRRLYLPETGEIVLSDTVGFLRKLPHHLVASFKSTLQSLTETDVLLIVVDAASPWIDAQLQTVEQVLTDIGVGDQSRLLVFNKADLVPDPFERKRLEALWPQAVFVSAVTGEGLDGLKSQLSNALRERAAGRSMALRIEDKVATYREPEPGPPRVE